MGKPVYRIIDKYGRVYLPADCRKTAGIGDGDIVRLDARHGQLTAHKVELIELGDQSPDAIAAYITAGIPYLSDEQLREVIGQVLNCVQKNKAEE